MKNKEKVISWLVWTVVFAAVLLLVVELKGGGV
jgi:hypothetical protein